MITSTPSAGSGAPPLAGQPAAGSTQAGLGQNFDTFLTLLTTQLKNQDPLSPLDTNQFTQQLVSFSQVEQAIATNKNLSTLIQMQSADETVGALPLVGRSIEYNGATAPLADGRAQFSYTLPTSAAQATLLVQDAQGHVVYSAAANPGAGRHDFTWNGQTSTGQQLPDGGSYTLQIMATRADRTPVTAAITATGTVNGVSVVDGQATFDVAGIKVPMSQLVTVNGNPS